MSEEPEQWIVVTEDAKTLPAIEILTGRGFVTGKSGSGKSNTASVVAEELLEAGYNCLIVDTEGEYFGLKEEYELLHVGRDERSDKQLELDACEEIARLTLQQNIPVIFDVSMVDLGTASDLVYAVSEQIFEMERQLEKPFLLVVEEIQEYLPQSGGADDLSKLLLRIAKRGRKRGLGLCGISQRPSSVDKDFITQCDWMVWHRLTWENDVSVVRNILGKDVADEVSTLDDGEAYLMTDWDDNVERVQFRRKKTFDAGATPGLEAYQSEDGDTDLDPPIDGVAREDLTIDSTLEPAASPSDPSEEAEEGAKGNGSPDHGGPEYDLGSDDLARMDEDELRDALREERRRSQILEDEIAELRRIYDQLDSTALESDGSPFSSDSSADEAQMSAPVPAPDPWDREMNSAASIILEIGFLVWSLVNYVMWSFRSTARRLRKLPGGRASEQPPALQADPSPTGRLEDYAVILIVLLGIGLFGLFIVVYNA